MAAGVLALGLAIVPLAGVAAAEGKADSDQPTAIKALQEGEVGLLFNYRWEHIQDDNPALTGSNTGDASTLRTVLSYRTARWKGFSGLVEFENVSNAGMENDHNDTQNGNTTLPVIADPADTELQQAWLRFRSPGNAQLTAGRMNLIYGQQRFVGPVVWRQNWQSFDAAEADVRAIPRTRLRVAWVDNVNRINTVNAEMSSWLINAEITVGDGKLTPYLYSLDYDAASTPELSTTTLGVRWQNTWDVPGPWAIPYHAEWARQDDTGSNPDNVDADYLRFELGGKHGAWSITAGYELLGGGPGDGAFSTPLATLHAYNGWADRFLTTPANGLQDLYLSGGWSREAWKTRLIWHDFGSDAGSMDYGTELDGLVSWTSSWKQTFAAKFALYDADEFAFDTEVFWVYTSWRM